MVLCGIVVGKDVVVGSVGHLLGGIDFVSLCEDIIRGDIVLRDESTFLIILIFHPLFLHL